MKSLSLLVSAEKMADANRLLEALGRGPDNFTVACSPAGILPATYYGSHTYDDELFDILASKTLPGGIVWADFDLTEARAGEALDAICCRSNDNSNAVVNFAGLAEALGVEIIVGENA